MLDDGYENDPVIMLRDQEIARLELEIEFIRETAGLRRDGQFQFGPAMDAAIGLARVPLLQAKIMAARAAKAARFKVLRLR